MDEVAFLQHDMAQDAVIRNIEIVGEASNNITKCDPDFAAQHDEIPWALIYAMRNRVSHAYHKVDLEIVWNMIQNDLPLLHQQVVDLLHELSKLRHSTSTVGINPARSPPCPSPCVPPCRSMPAPYRPAHGGPTHGA